MKYCDLLLTDEWRTQRLSILERDEWVCQRCGQSPNDADDYIGSIPITYEPDLHRLFADRSGPGIEVVRAPWLEVHHKWYILGRAPWEYPDRAFVTLCCYCHDAVHAEGWMPPVYENSPEEQPIEEGRCGRCGGRGWIPKYSHVQQGICFQCWGTGYEFLGIQEVEHSSKPTTRRKDGGTLPASRNRFWPRVPGIYISGLSRVASVGDGRSFFKLELVRRYRLSRTTAVRYFWTEGKHRLVHGHLASLSKDADLNGYYAGIDVRLVDIYPRPVRGIDRDCLCNSDDDSVCFQSAKLIVLPGETTEDALASSLRNAQMRPE